MKFLAFLLFLGLVCDTLKTGNEATIVIFTFFIVIYAFVTIKKYISFLLASYNKNKIISDKGMEKLEKITILKLQGALTDEEFEEHKEKILRKYK